MGGAGGRGLLARLGPLMAVAALACAATDAAATQKRRKTALIEGDILIGALFSVHEFPKQKTASTLTCGKIREQYGIQRVEAAFLAIDQINNNTELLPDIRLGVEIRDSCWYSSIALEQSLEFIRDALSPPGDTTNTSARADSCKAANRKKQMVGVVGPGSSDVTIQVQNLLQLFSIPQVGYSATSRDLSDKARFSYFMRVVPSDYYQAQVLIDIVRYYNWTYVSTVHTDGNYGQSGMKAFQMLAENHNVCIAKEDSVRSNAEDEAFDDVIKKLQEDSRANVVVCFCEGKTITNLLKAAQRNNVTSRFQFIGSDGWADRSDVVPAGLEAAAVGGLSIKIQSSLVKEFDEYYFALDPDTNSRNPWFREFWQHRFNCSLPGATERDGEEAMFPPCSNTETLRKDYKQDTKMAFVMKAIYTMAWGLHNMQRALCRPGEGLCKAMLPINGSLYRDYLMNVTFTYHDETVTFDSSGDPPGRYNIMNYQLRADGSYEYVLVGTWDNGTLDVNHTLVEFNTLDSHPPTSVCSDPCRYNEFKSGDGTQMCCWVCTPCGENQYLKNETACEDCQPGYKPNLNMSGCDAIPVEHLTWDAPESIAALTLACLGFLATCFTMTVFLKYNHTPVVKASTRELSYIIFVGMMVSYCATLPLLARPSPLTCAASRVLPGLSFAMIYAALVTKTNRIARILAGNKKITMRKPRFMSATAQVVITCGLIGIELGIITAMLILDIPNSRHDYPNHDQVMLVCNTTDRAIIAPLAWDFFLILMCTVYAVKTRNLPENFNEAKFIGFSMYTTCVIWLAWFPIYFGSRHKIICMSMCTSLSALVTLVLLFFPKLYIMLFRPEKNDRSAFKTAKTVRCHIGSSNKTSLSRPSDPTPSAAVESMYVGSAMLGLMPQQLTLMQRLKTSIAAAPFLASATAGAHPRTTLKREISVWSDASGSGGGGAASAREAMLRRAYGSQLDLTGEGWSGVPREERACQTTDDLLDPLIPRLRRRVVRAVRENKLDAAEGREFFSLTHGWMTSQAEAARNEMRRGDTDPEKVAAAAAAAATITAVTTTTTATTTTATTTTAVITTTTTTATTSSSPNPVTPTTPAAATSTTATQSDHPTTTATSTTTSTTPTDRNTPAPVITTTTAATTPASTTTTTTTCSTTTTTTTPNRQDHHISSTTTQTPTTNTSSCNSSNVTATTTATTTTNNNNNTVVPTGHHHPSAPSHEVTGTTTTTTTTTITNTSTVTTSSAPTTSSTTTTSTSNHAGEASHALPPATITPQPPTTWQAAPYSPVKGLALSQAAGEGTRMGETSGAEGRCETGGREATTLRGVNGEEEDGCRGVMERDGVGLVTGNGALCHPHEALCEALEYGGRVLECQGSEEAGWAAPRSSTVSTECPGKENLGFVGYGSPMPCVVSGGDGGGGGWAAAPDPPAARVPVAEAMLEGAAWGGGGDCEKLLVEAKPRGARRVEVLGRREVRHRRRKVGVAARVADVRGILRCVAFPRTDRAARVSFDTAAVKESSPHWAGSPRQGSEGDGEQEAPFSILEESDAEASDSCEMKTIIIRLGSGGGDEEGGGSNTGSNGGSGGGVGCESGGSRGGGAFINWRPRLGRNHQALSRRPATALQTAAPRPARHPAPPHPSQRSSELVILDLLRRSKGQGAPLPSPPPTSEPPLDQIILPPPRQYSPAAPPHHPLLLNHVHTELPSTSPTHVSSPSTSPSSSSSSPRGEVSTVEESHHHNHNYNHHHHHAPSPPPPPPHTFGPAQAPQANNSEHEALPAPPPAPPRPDTDEDTDDGSTTPIKEFFLNHGVRFDATSATSKKL